MSGLEYEITGLLHLGYTVNDMDAAVDFWIHKLGVEVCRQQYVDQPYVAQVTGVANCAVKVALIQPEGDELMVEALEYVRPIDRTLVRQPGEASHAHMGYLVEGIEAYHDKLMSMGVVGLTPLQIIDCGVYRGRKAFSTTDPMGVYILFVEDRDNKSGRARITKLDYVCFCVKSLDSVIETWRDRLGFTINIENTEKSMYLASLCPNGKTCPNRIAVCTSEKCMITIELWETGVADVPGAIKPSTGGNIHICFLVKGINMLYQDFTKKGVIFAACQPADVTFGINKGAKAVYFEINDNNWAEVFEAKPLLI